MILRLALTTGLMAGTAGAQQVSEAEGVVLRGLDKISGQVYDIEMKSGQTAAFEQLRITLNSCRFPVGNPSGDAFAALEIADALDGSTVFSGWMIASAPALSAMDHARYDLWVMRCTTS
ncbi:DUF2155 domain-containing protein [uncultured Roseobacter sp.]|uniref:DUF2155 domain-containing protein n=1 Tax=uncultured Roseobacter sp. TaxID=114847 RepID=UPI002630657E|nr:DUF2155 domain-containing protein [uncultured Roseobacter sp.]